MAKVEVWYRTHKMDVDFSKVVNSLKKSFNTIVDIEGVYVIDLKGLEISDYKLFFSDSENGDEEFTEDFLTEYSDFIEQVSGTTHWKIEISVKSEAKKLVSLFMCLAFNGNSGHSYGYSIGSDKYGLDGDGSDSILKIFLNNEKVYDIKKQNNTKKIADKYVYDAEYVKCREE